MEKSFAVLIIAVLLLGCASFQINDNPNVQFMAYAAGKAMAIGVNKVDPSIDARLTAEWVDMMDRNKGQTVISSAEMLRFYNRCISIIGLKVNDKYGLIGDLSMLIRIYGAQFDNTGVMVAVQPVPIPVMEVFGQGWANGRAISQ